MLECRQACEVQKIFLYGIRNSNKKISVLLTDHSVIDECK